MNMIGTTNGGCFILGMTQAESEAFSKLENSRLGMPSGLVLAEVSPKQVAVFLEMVSCLKKELKNLRSSAKSLARRSLSAKGAARDNS